MRKTCVTSRRTYAHRAPNGLASYHFRVGLITTTIAQSSDRLNTDNLTLSCAKWAL